MSGLCEEGVETGGHGGGGRDLVRRLLMEARGGGHTASPKAPVEVAVESKTVGKLCRAPKTSVQKGW